MVNQDEISFDILLITSLILVLMSMNDSIFLLISLGLEN